MSLITSNHPTAIPPEAWLGFKVKPVTGDVLIRVCMDCESRGTAEQLAEEMGAPVTHSLCSRHYQARISEITGDKSA